MGLFDRKRYAVATILLGVEGAPVRPLMAALGRSTRRIVETEGEFEVASEEMFHTVERLIEHEHAWSHAGNWGEVFNKEEDAGRYGEECFADCAGRYLSSGGGSGEDESGAAGDAAEGPLVVMLTVAYQGKVGELERTLATRGEVASALSAIAALHHQGRLELAHIHFAPAQEDEVLTEDRMLVGYPELLSL